jgi:hypothetical protein
MKRSWRLFAAGIGLGLVTASGCQTWVPEAGLTLPSGHYLRHPPQLIPQSPPFPLPRETANLEEATAQQAPAPPQAMGGGVQ